MADDFRLQEEYQNLQDVSNYLIPQEHDVRSMDSGEIVALLEGVVKHAVSQRCTDSGLGAVESVAESSENITNPAVFDVYRSLLK